MFNLSKDRLSLANYACGIAVLLMLILQFLPFWSYSYEGPKEDVVAAENAEEEVVEEEMVEKNASLSIASYIWFPTSEPATALIYQYIPEALDTPVPAPPVAKGIKQEVVEGAIVENDIVLQPVLQFIFSLIVIGLCYYATQSIGIAILSILNGVFGIYAYIMNPVMQLGFLWQLHLVVSIIILIAGIVSFVFCTKALMQKRRERLAFLENKSLSRAKTTN